MIHRREILRRLSELDAVPEICLNHPEGVVVSTVHRAKGGEADQVFWLDTPLTYQGRDGEDEKYDALKASYVALTRARQGIRLVKPKKRYMKQLSSGRWIQTGASQKSGKTRIYCANIAMQAGDADPFSFIPDEGAEEIQELLSDLESGTDVSLYLAEDEKQFHILFEGTQIGSTEESFMRALFEGFRETNHNKNLPADLESVYISELVTVIQPESEASDNVYRRSGCWIGCELGGFAHINY